MLKERLRIFYGDTASVEINSRPGETLVKVVLPEILYTGGAQSISYLVDDETAMLDILQQVIQWEELGIKKVYTARNAEQAKELLQEKKIDITLCDIEMPKESGLDFNRMDTGAVSVCSEYHTHGTCRF